MTGPKRDSTHECPHPRCSRRVDRSQFACRPHWYQLPKPIRDTIWSGWRSGNEAEHEAGMRQALDFYEGLAVQP